MTCVFDVSMPAQFDIMLADAMPSNIFFWAHSLSVNSASSELLRVKRPNQIATKERRIEQSRSENIMHYYEVSMWILTYFSLAD